MELGLGELKEVNQAVPKSLMCFWRTCCTTIPDMASFHRIVCVCHTVQNLLFINNRNKALLSYSLIDSKLLWQPHTNLVIVSLKPPPMAPTIKASTSSLGTVLQQSSCFHLWHSCLSKSNTHANQGLLCGSICGCGYLAS